jgi:hypothetical protein
MNNTINGERNEYSMSPFTSIDIVQQIVSFVGRYQYRFIATINKDFKAAYLKQFNYDRRTYYNASTINHARICCLEGPEITTTPILCASAAKHGSIVTLQYLRSIDSPWNESICSIAAANGHFELLQYAHANGCPWDSDTCRGAAKKGHLDILQWARANGCPWSSATCWEAKRFRHEKVLQWARVHGCPCDTYEWSEAA